MTRKLKKGEVPWSPKLQRFRTEIEIWALILKKRKGKRTSVKKIRRLLKKSKIVDAFDLPRTFSGILGNVFMRVLGVDPGRLLSLP